MKPSSTASRLWPILGPLTPSLSADALVNVQHFRGEPWFVVTDRAGGESYRLSAAMQVVLTKDARSGTLAERVARRYPEAGAEFLEQIALAAMQLYRASLLVFEPASSVPPELRQMRSAGGRGRRLNPLAIRIPLLDPDRWLARCEPLGRAIFSMPFTLFVMVVVGAFAVLGAMHAPALGADLLSRLESVHSWVMFAGCYVALKAFHEMAHALAVKRWGGHVHDIGVMLLVFFPVPYVDASASTAFTDKFRRIAVAVAGIAAELLVAGVAMILWLNTEPGIVHTLAFNLVVIGGVSTLLFNGNPLMRFDAYYALSDLIEIPNLYNRSRSYLNHLALRCFLGAHTAATPPASPAEARWLLAYGLTSLVYRTGVLLAIAFYLGSRFFFIGVALAVWLTATEFVLPVIRFFAQLRRLDGSAGRQFGAFGRGLAAIAVAGAFVAFVPLPQSTVATGIVTVDDDAQVRASSDGFVRRVHAHSGDRVAAGSPVVTLENDELVRDLAVARARVVELEARRTVAATVDRVATRVIEDGLQASRRAEADIAARVEALGVPAPAAGRFVAPDLDRLEGTWVERGQTLGYVTDPSRLIVRVVVPETRMDLFQGPVQAVALRFAEAPDLEIAARPAGDVPASLTRLPSAALGSHGRGPIPVDPGDPDGLTPLVRVFQMDLEPLGRLEGVRVSGRVHARFVHQSEALLPRAVRAARRLFLAKFST